MSYEPVHSQELESYHISFVACGTHHSAAISGKSSRHCHQRVYLLFEVEKYWKNNGRQRKQKVAGLSPALSTKLELFLGRRWFNSSVTLVNSHLLCFPPVGFFFEPVIF